MIGYRTDSLSLFIACALTLTCQFIGYCLWHGRCLTTTERCVPYFSKDALLHRIPAEGVGGYSGFGSQRLPSRVSIAFFLSVNSVDKFLHEGWVRDALLLSPDAVRSFRNQIESLSKLPRRREQSTDGGLQDRFGSHLHISSALSAPRRQLKPRVSHVVAERLQHALKLFSGSNSTRFCIWRLS